MSDARAASTARYGTWPSTLSPELLARSGDPWKRFERPETGPTGTYWLESRTDTGRAVVVHKPVSGAAYDITPLGFDARSSVHEYGGAAYFLDEPIVFFSNFSDGRIYRQGPGVAPQAITPEPAVPRALRYADGVVLPGGSSILCVRERHEPAGVLNELVMLVADGSGEPHVVVDGHDFFASPCVSSDGSRIAWIAWNLPSMPFTSSELWTAGLNADGTLDAPRCVAGGPEESVFQPSWSPSGELHYVSDRSGWWNLYRIRDGQHQAVSPMSAEQGWPQWCCSLSSYGFVSTGEIACLVNRGVQQRLVLVDPEHGTIDEPEIPCTAVLWPYLRACGSRVVFVAASDTESPAVIAWDAVTRTHEVVQPGAEPIERERISCPRRVEFPARDGSIGKATYYAPVNPDVVPPEDELPPLLVLAHGGPTHQAAGGLRLDVQIFTSRGIGVLEVDYGGSTGYGRAYAQRLHARWGVVDTEDCVTAALHLAGLGEVDGRRMLISGGSAGGYIVLCALAFHDTFIGGMSLYGISDLTAWAIGTHKFEAGYTDWLVGPIEAAAETYRQRSPVHFADQITSPLLLLQGLDDHVVPPSQAEAIVAALQQSGTYNRYLAFEGEGHGFREASNIQAVWEEQLAFLAKVLGLT